MPIIFRFFTVFVIVREKLDKKKDIIRNIRDAIRTICQAMEPLQIPLEKESLRPQLDWIIDHSNEYDLNLPNVDKF